MLFCFHFLIYQGSLLSWLWSERFTVVPFLHQTMKTGCPLQCCRKLSSFLLNRDSSHVRHTASVQHRSLFRKLICFVIALSDELSKERHSQHFLWAVCFDVLDLHQCAFKMDSTQFFPHPTGRCPSHLVQCTESHISTHHQWSPFVVNVHGYRTDSFPEEAQEGRSSSS